ncbi:MAG: SDR family NAD(P)-dependent oxidoreductase, partial [Polyangiaceae bacterium]
AALGVLGRSPGKTSSWRFGEADREAAAEVLTGLLPSGTRSNLMDRKVILVTGCASGIGRSLAKRLYEAGHTLTLTDVNEDGLRRAAKADGLSDESRVTLRALDVCDPEAWRAAIRDVVERSGRIDTLVNVAGILVPVWAHEASDDDVHRTIDINTKGLIFGTNAALRPMIAQKQGHVVNVASLGGVVPVPGLALYSASKHAARAYSIAVGQEVRKHNVFVTAVCPGLVATPMMDIQIDREEAAFSFSSRRPLTVDEVTAAIVDRAMVKRPLELLVDVPGSLQGIVAKLGNAFPALAMRLGDRVARVGSANQSRTRR